MGFKSRNIFGAQLNRNFKAGSKIADNVTKSLLLGGLVGADYIYRKSQQPRSKHRPLTTHELREIEELELQLATPFNFTKIVIFHSLLYVLAIVSPIVGAYLYCYEDWYMFLSVLIFGIFELCLTLPTMLIDVNMDSEWIFSKDNERQKSQVKIILRLSIITNAILILLNSYPFILQISLFTPYPYEGGVLVTIMTLFLYFINVGCIIENAKIFRHIDKYFEQNISKFSEIRSHKDIHNSNDQLNVQANNISESVNNSIEQIQTYIDRCNSEQISLEIIKANIRILNAMTDSYKRGYSELTNSILERRLEEKINSAKRDFVKRECRLALDILNMLKTQSVDDVIATLKQKYPY